MPENRRDLLNAYDNTIRYTDYILHGIVERLQKWELVQTKARNNKPDGIYCQPTSAMLYTSDHGENIFDDNRNLFLHAAPKASDYELHVPFIIWTSQGFDKKYPKVVKALADNHTKQVQTSLSVFHTLLGIGGIRPDTARMNTRWQVNCITRAGCYIWMTIMRQFRRMRLNISTNLSSQGFSSNI